MKLVAKYNKTWIIVDTEKKTFEFVERATAEVEAKILDDIALHQTIKQVKS